MSWLSWREGDQLLKKRYRLTQGPIEHNIDPKQTVLLHIDQCVTVNEEFNLWNIELHNCLKPQIRFTYRPHEDNLMFAFFSPPVVTSRSPVNRDSSVTLKHQCVRACTYSQMSQAMPDVLADLSSTGCWGYVFESGTWLRYLLVPL